MGNPTMNVHTRENYSDIKNKVKLFSRKCLEPIGQADHVIQIGTLSK